MTPDFPWVNFLLFGLAVALLGLGLRRAFTNSRVYRGKVSGSVLAVASVAIPEAAITLLFRAAEQAEIVGSNFRRQSCCFCWCRVIRNSGAVYVLDRKKGTWYCGDFDDEQFGGYSVSQPEQLLKECQFLDLVERSELWRAGLSWWVEPGKAPEARV